MLVCAPSGSDLGVVCLEAGGIVVRAEQLAEIAGVSLRTLQRRFHAYVGIGPKWVVQRFRLLDVTSAAHGDADVDWAGLAVRLGYADQSHLTREWTTFAGCSPSEWRRRELPSVQAGEPRSSAG